MIFDLKIFIRNVFMDIKSLFMYASPIWFPNTSSSLVQKLQIFQNSALHVVTSCVKITSIDHPHEETKMLLEIDVKINIQSIYFKLFYSCIS